MCLFTAQINNWREWGEIFQSIPAFAPLINYIFMKEQLPAAEIENLQPGTNAVFKAGDYVIKIFAPQGLGSGFGTHVDVELFGMKQANASEIPAPKLIAEGVVEDKYHFRYMIMDYIRGKMLNEVEDSLTYEDKVSIGKQIRNITQKLNVPCENFTSVDMLRYAMENEEWKDDGFPPSFLEERLAYLVGFHIDENDKVYCHGDFHCGNVLIDDEKKVYLIDFADAMYAPAPYEQVYIISALFCFEKPYMTGYFGGDYDADEIVDFCMTWLPVHAWGHSAIKGNLDTVDEISSFAVLRERLCDLIKERKGALTK